MSDLAIPTFNETIVYGRNPEALWEINPGTKKLFDAGQETNPLQNIFEKWESSVSEWAETVNPTDNPGYHRTFDLSDKTEQITLDLAESAVRNFGCIVFQDNEIGAARAASKMALVNFQSTSWFTMKSDKMDSLLDCTVVSPIATLLRYRAVLADLRSGGPGFME